MNLLLRLKGEYFKEIQEGKKEFEYRLKTPYWAARLVGKKYEKIVITHGYPKMTELDRILVFPWKGWELHTITHKHFGPDPVEVFAIKLEAKT
uniref:ASCH domain-containing protein n=1 Tax=uncultured marine virus TaxID=186617 RepID=A0A0F7L8N6_9VIRU|nr:hypothetical protein pOZ176_074 [uncultured marine virus]